MGSVYSYLESIKLKKKAGYLVLIDPDKKNDSRLETLVDSVNQTGVDAILVGGSLMMDSSFNDRAERIKSLSEVPVILFPGSVSLLGPLFVKDLGLEPLPTGYMLFEGGGHSSVEFMSNSRPLPLNRPEIAVAHGLAGQYLGMKLLYLESGSGALRTVPKETISAIARNCDIPIIVGGGISEPEIAVEKVKAGASFIVTGTASEADDSAKIMNDFADAIHGI